MSANDRGLLRAEWTRVVSTPGIKLRMAAENRSAQWPRVAEIDRAVSTVRESLIGQGHSWADAEHRALELVRSRLSPDEWSMYRNEMALFRERGVPQPPEN